MTKLLLFFWAAVLLATQAVGQGFAPTATNWTLPTGGQISSNIDYGFRSLNNYGYNPYGYNYSPDNDGSQSWVSADLNGDSKLDMIVLCQRQAGVFLPFGTATNRYWKVYLGTATGFALTALNWALPAGGQVTTNGAASFNIPNYGGHIGADSDGSQSWTMLDANGDGKYDLVVTAQLQTGNYLPFGTAANRYWKVYLNTGSGFATTALNWTLPAGGQLSGGVAYGFNWLSHIADSADNDGSQAWEVSDINGDAKIDLIVLTQRQAGTFLLFGTAPSRYWKVYLGTSSGFATTALNWTLPTGGQLSGTTDYGFSTWSYEANNDGTYGNYTPGNESWSVQDANGDRKPDIIVYSQIQGSSNLPFGSSPAFYWKVYLGTANGFATTALNWTLPVGGRLSGIDYSFNALGYNGDSGTDNDGSQAWDVRDLNGDAKPDLIVLTQLQAGVFLPFGTATNSYWQVYLGTATGFATTALNWALPMGGRVTTSGSFGFNLLRAEGSNYDRNGSQIWSVFDANGDGQADLIIPAQYQGTTPLTFGTAPNRYWKVYLGSATPLAATAPASLAAGVHLYPNPATGQLTLSSPASLAGQPYALLDVLGRPVRTGLLGAAEATLDVQALPAGVYGVRLGTESHLLRFVKQ